MASKGTKVCVWDAFGTYSCGSGIANTFPAAEGFTGGPASVDATLGSTVGAPVPVSVPAQAQAQAQAQAHPQRPSGKTGHEGFCGCSGGVLP